MWQHQNLWRKLGRGYRWRWSPVVGKTQQFEDAITTGWPLRTVANMEWGWPELLRQAVCAMDIRAGEVEPTSHFGHQKIVSPRSLSLNPYTTKLCFYFNLILPSLNSSWHIQSWGFYFNWSCTSTKAISWPLLVPCSVTLCGTSMPSKPVPNAYTLPGSPASRRYSLGPLDHSFCVLTPGNTPRDFYINDAGPFLIHC